MSKFLFFLFTLTVFLPFSSQAHFDRMVRQKLTEQAIVQLGDPSLEKRMAATNSFLNFPEMGLPVLRSAIQEDQYSHFHWRVAYLLGVIGTPADIPLILEQTPEEAESYEKKVWKGAAERISWRYRTRPGRKPIISRLRFLTESNQQGIVSGQLIYRIVNPDNDARLVRPRFSVFHAQLQEALELPYHWIEKGEVFEYSVPLSFKVFPQRNRVRIDLNVAEVGNTDSIEKAHNKIEVSIR